MSYSILASIISKTKLFIENTQKSIRKKKGQFFTSMETAKYMTEILDDL